MGKVRNLSPPVRGRREVISELETEISIPSTVQYEMHEGTVEVGEIWLNGLGKIIHLEDLPKKERRAIIELCRQHAAKQAGEANV